MDDENYEELEQALEQSAAEVAAEIHCAQDAGVDVGAMIFRLMYPLVPMSTGESCDIEGCHCGGENEKILMICSAIN